MENEAGESLAADVEQPPAKKIFECSACKLTEEYEYFGREPPHTKRYKLNEDCYVIEDPFQVPRLGQFIILGAHCKICKKTICKDAQCSFYYDGTMCVGCAKTIRHSFPDVVQEKLNKII